MRYPDRLAARLREAGPAGPARVVNAGISGNRLLTDGIGPKGIDRFAHDVLAQSGVTHVVILIGINDIGFSVPEGAAGAGPRPAGGAGLTAGLQRLIEQARARGVKVLLGTLLPFKGSGYWSEENEARRAGREPLDPRPARCRRGGRLRCRAARPARSAGAEAAYDSGDHLHPGERRLCRDGRRDRPAELLRNRPAHVAVTAASHLYTRLRRVAYSSVHMAQGG